MSRSPYSTTFYKAKLMHQNSISHRKYYFISPKLWGIYMYFSNHDFSLLEKDMQFLWPLTIFISCLHFGISPSLA